MQSKQSELQSAILDLALEVTEQPTPKPDTKGGLSTPFLDHMLETTAASTQTSTAQMLSAGVWIGWIEQMNNSHVQVFIPSVEPSAEGQVVMALSTVQLSESAIGQQVVVLLSEHSHVPPMVIGCLQQTVLLLSAEEVTQERSEQDLHLSAEHSLTLQCGRASLSLDASGRIDLRGTTIVSHASGLNRVRGGSIKLN